MVPGEKISLLVMRDNGAARRLRMRRSVLIVLLVFMVVSPFVAAAGIWFGVDVWLRHKNLLRESQRMEQEYQEAKATAARLRNLEKLLVYRDAAETAQLMQNLQRGGADPVDASAASGAEGADGPGHSEFPAINTGFISVDNVSVRLLPGNKLRISLDLNNPDSRKTIAGKVSCTMTTAGGDVVPLEVAPPSAGDFRISRLKRAVLAAALPAGVDAANAQTVIEVRSEGGEIEYRNVFPVAR